ncbi:hypothetical protein SCAR479_07537 [Seiridium cardinale]|uniref:Uncharacterized protein n=1 Tax=Seiridium cardinale TaxID=138064 RepID=A0ABR2XQ34_9PEZI
MLSTFLSQSTLSFSTSNPSETPRYTTGTSPGSPPSRPIPALASLKGSEPVDDLETSPAPEDVGIAAHTGPRDVSGFPIRFGKPEVSSAVSVLDDQAFVRYG